MHTISKPGLAKCSLFALAISLLGSLTARSIEPEEAYLPIFNLIQAADALKNQGQAELARAKYERALADLRNFQGAYPTFNLKMVAYRSNDLAQKIAALNAPAAPVQAEQPADSGAPAKAAGGGLAWQVKVLNAGAEPHKTLRLHPKPGDKQTLIMTMKMAMDLKMGETQTPVKLPAMRMVMDATVKEATAEGDITYETVMSDADITDDPDVLAPVADAMKKSLASIKGLTSKGVMSTRGFNKGTDLKIPDDADPQMRQAIDQMKESFSRISAPLPEEPVGLGAKWSVKMPLKSQGITINQTTTYELVSLENERLATKITIVQTAAGQKIENPAMPGLKLDLTQMTGAGTGDTTLNLGQLMPLAGTVDMHSELSMNMDTGGQKQAMNMKLEMNVKMEGK
jgi:hypothetical protein